MVIETDEREDFLQSPSFLNDIDFRCDIGDDGTSTGELMVGPELLAPGSGTVRPAVLATVADVVAGLPAAAALSPRLPLTLDIDLRILGPTGDRLWASSRLLKIGRNTIAAEVLFTNGRAGAPVAVGYLTFIASPRPQDMVPHQLVGMHTSGALTKPITEHIGAHVMTPGVVEIEHRPFVTQASGTLQGGVVALIGELAAESVAGRSVIALDTRYLATVRVGPARAVATPLGHEHMRVEVRDTGNADRLAARILARVSTAGTTAAG